ncbi:hypothetical protein H2248_006750 [Termitomyces sp. 'cryptogamus']|nr:hypothetical protein H2248_006750 [Termitomyces sp. 'cryptogamus']
MARNFYADSRVCSCGVHVTLITSISAYLICWYLYFKVARASPEHFWPYSLLLFKNQGDYFDIPASTLTPLQVRENLAKLAAQVIPPAAVEEFKELLRLKSTPNGGNAVTDDLKYTIKFSRQNSIHVSPTVLWDGLVANEISSSWGTKEWSEFLAAKVKV